MPSHSRSAVDTVFRTQESPAIASCAQEVAEILEDLRPWLTPRALGLIAFVPEQAADDTPAYITVGSHIIAAHSWLDVQPRSLIGPLTTSCHGYGVWWSSDGEWDGEPGMATSYLREAILYALAQELRDVDNQAIGRCPTNTYEG